MTSMYIEVLVWTGLQVSTVIYFTPMSRAIYKLCLCMLCGDRNALCFAYGTYIQLTW